MKKKSEKSEESQFISVSITLIKNTNFARILVCCAKTHLPKKPRDASTYSADRASLSRCTITWGGLHLKLAQPLVSFLPAHAIYTRPRNTTHEDESVQRKMTKKHVAPASTTFTHDGLLRQEGTSKDTHDGNNFFKSRKAIHAP